MKVTISPIAHAAIDTVLRPLSAYRDQLAALDHALGILMDALGELKAGNLLDEAPVEFEQAKGILEGFPSEKEWMEKVGPALVVLAREIMEQEK